MPRSGQAHTKRIVGRGGSGHSQIPRRQHHHDDAALPCLDMTGCEGVHSLGAAPSGSSFHASSSSVVTRLPSASSTPHRSPPRLRSRFS
ncbi:hypothetical protein SAMN06264364_105160 [Quadrisphaera granulorum]|uniref:Uncharacterized protein n=1 Tax=Quadrisphaera granulorum TaxID=317664 RepID=A0A316ABE0_9ACTN|nr:hypothetical protein BXY45_105160 [Quadrisphaera granulorum]SZE95897.1 hypothetical protein SAMN06264364_105160 [Quadrisphaera granulorum]